MESSVEAYCVVLRLRYDPSMTNGLEDKLDTGDCVKNADHARELKHVNKPKR